MTSAVDSAIGRYGSEAGLMEGGRRGSLMSLPSLEEYGEKPIDTNQNGSEDAEAPLESSHKSVDSRNVLYSSQNVYLCDLRHDACEVPHLPGPPDTGLVSKWRMKDRMKTSSVALILCLNIGVDPPDVIKISPCARMECWIDPFSMSALKAIEAIGKNLQAQYERWQPRARYKLQPDPTVEEVKKLCLGCRKSARSERVLFHYNGHGVPKPTASGEIWLFNKSYTEYIPLSLLELETWMGTPSIYVFDCSAAGMIVNAFDQGQSGADSPEPDLATANQCTWAADPVNDLLNYPSSLPRLEQSDWGQSASSSSSSTTVPTIRDCILLAACGANETLPQSAELPADVFTSCLTTPIKIALRWFFSQSLLRDTLNPDIISKIPGRQNDRKTLLGELNWIFTAITDTIAWNVLPRELFQRLFRQDLLVASLFRNFLLAERIMRSGNCSPQSYPRLPPTHQHPMWHAWDMAAEICLSQLPLLLKDPNAEFQPSPFFTEQLTAFEVWLDYGSEKKKPPEQLPIVLQVLLSQSHRFRALVLLGRFLDMGAWAVDLALSVGIFPYVLKLLQTNAAELRQILVFIWTKILALDKSCQVDLVKDNGHLYFIKFLDSPDIFSEQRAMAAFVLAVIVDSHRRGQEACFKAQVLDICLKHIKFSSKSENPPEPLLLQWLCLCLGKLWDGYYDAQRSGLQVDAPAVLSQLLAAPHPEVRASATYALGTLIDIGGDNSGVSSSCLEEEFEDEERCRPDEYIAKFLLKVQVDGSPLVRAELAIGLSRIAVGHNKSLKSVAAAYLKPPSNSLLTSLPALASIRSPTGSMGHGSSLRVGSDGGGDRNPDGTSPLLLSSPSSSDGLSHLAEESRGMGNGGGGVSKSWRPRGYENAFYSQCVTVMYALGRDPSPRVSSLGRQVLRMIGVEPVVVNHVRPAATASGHHRTASVGAFPPPASLTGLPRSFSWIDSPSGHFSLTLRTPPASPPANQSFLTGSGMRRVCSLEFGPHMRRSADTGLADTALVGVGMSLSSQVTVVPVSSLYTWSCAHFAQPLLEPSHEDNGEASISRREDNEQSALKGISICQRSNVSKVSDQIASWDTESGNSICSVLLHPFLPSVCAVDENEMIRIWDYGVGAVVNEFSNHNAADKGVAKVCLLNELEDSLLLVASSDGCVRVWKDYTERDQNHLVTAWQTIQGHRPGARSINAVVDWQQMAGYLYASGDISSIMVWDLNQELLAFSIHSGSDQSVSALSASQVHPRHVISGFGDGSVRVYDIRCRDLVCSTAAHTQRIVGINFVPGMDSTKIVSASQAGDLRFLDIRNGLGLYQKVDAFKGSLSAMAVHRHAPFIAVGSSKQFLRVFNTSGDQVAVIRYHNSYIGQRIGPVSSLNFHPYKVCLAAGATDSIVSIYSGDPLHS